MTDQSRDGDSTGCAVLGVACGSSHSLAVLENGTVLSWGRGEDGQLGHGDAEERLSPAAIFGLRDAGITSVYCGAEYSLGISTTNNEVYSWGWGDFGRLGHADCQDLFVPKPISALSGRAVVHVSCGDTHTCAVTDSGAVFSFGRNQNGQLGLGSDEDALTPTLVSALEDHRVTGIACGAEHTVACCENGQAFAFGWGRYGNLGDGHCADRWLPIKITELEGNHVVRVACGWRHSVVVDKEGRIFTFGWSKYGQLGHGSLADLAAPKQVQGLKSRRITLISGGWRHTVAADDAGNLHAWGWNKFGQLGIGTNAQIEARPQPVALQIHQNRIRCLACGWRHTLVTTTDGQVYGWGRGVNGQIGYGEQIDRTSPFLLENISAGTMDPEALIRAATPISSFVAPADRYAVVPGAFTAVNMSAAMAVPQYKKPRVEETVPEA